MVVIIALVKGILPKRAMTFLVMVSLLILLHSNCFVACLNLIP